MKNKQTGEGEGNRRENSPHPSSYPIPPCSLPVPNAPTADPLRVPPLLVAAFFALAIFCFSLLFPGYFLIIFHLFMYLFIYFYVIQTDNFLKKI